MKRDSLFLFPPTNSSTTGLGFFPPAQPLFFMQNQSRDLRLARLASFNQNSTIEGLYGDDLSGNNEFESVIHTSNKFDQSSLNAFTNIQSQQFYDSNSWQPTMWYNENLQNDEFQSVIFANGYGCQEFDFVNNNELSANHRRVNSFGEHSQSDINKNKMPNKSSSCMKKRKRNRAKTAKTIFFVDVVKTQRKTSRSPSMKFRKMSLFRNYENQDIDLKKPVVSYKKPEIFSKKQNNCK